MDYDVYCGECCKCDSAIHKYESQVSGKGDYECNDDVTLTQGSGKKSCERKKQLKEKEFWNHDKMDKKTDKKTGLSEKHCNCCRSTKEPQGKHRMENNHEKSHLDLLENYDNNNLYQLLASDWTLTKALSAENANVRNSSPERLLRSNFLHLEGKVNYLMQLFKDRCHKLPDDIPLEQSYLKPTRSSYEEIFHLLSLNKRMCAAEDGIEKLTWILEELLNEFRKKADSQGVSEDWKCNTSGDLDETSIEQRVKSLLHRNDILGKLMKTCVKVSLRENKVSKEGKTKKMIEASPKHEGNQKLEEVNGTGEANMGHVYKEGRQSIKKSKYCAVKDSQMCIVNDSENLKATDQSEDKEKNATGNKLEVISEAGEFSITPKLEREISELSKKLGIKNLKEFLINDGEDGESSLEISSVPKSLINDEVQNAAFEKISGELIPRTESHKKNCIKIKLNQITASDENVDLSDNEINVGIVSNFPNSFGNKLKSTKLPSRISTKHVKPQDSKMSKKDSKIISKTGSKGVKKSEEKTEPKKPKTTQRVASKCSSTVGTPRQKSEYTPPNCSEQRLGVCRSGLAINQRPMTAPHADRKQMSTGGLSKSSSKNHLKTSPQPENTKKSNSTNVKNKNKNLQKKKSLIQES